MAAMCAESNLPMPSGLQADDVVHEYHFKKMGLFRVFPSAPFLGGQVEAVQSGQSKDDPGERLHRPGDFDEATAYRCRKTHDVD